MGKNSVFSKTDMINVYREIRKFLDPFIFWSFFVSNFFMTF